MLKNLHLPIASLLLCGTGITQDGGVYQEDDGLVVIEIESTHAADGWAVESSTAGYTFQSYYRWDGGDQFSTPGLGRLSYLINLDQGGTWMLSLRNRHEDPDSTLENDVWVRADGGSWYKLFSNGTGTIGAWNWVSRFDFGSQPPASWNFSPGEHEIEFSGRSQNFKMDRFHLHKAGHPDANNEAVPESTALLGNSYCGPAVVNSTGMAGDCEAWGSTFVSNNNVLLTGSNLPPNKFAFFVASRTQGFAQGPGGSQGNLCLAGKIGRYANDILNTKNAGRVELQIDLTSIPTSPPDSVLSGEAWNFQLWYRDSNPGSTSNFTDGRRIRFQ